MQPSQAQASKQAESATLGKVGRVCTAMREHNMLQKYLYYPSKMRCITFHLFWTLINNITITLCVVIVEQEKA